MRVCGRCPVMVLGQGQLRPPSSPVSSRLAAGGSDGGWAQGPVGLGVLFPTTPPCPPVTPYSPGLRDPGRAGQLIFRQWGQVACSGLPGLIPWSHPPPNKQAQPQGSPLGLTRCPHAPPLCPGSSPGGPVAPSLFPSPTHYVVTRIPEHQLWARAEGVPVSGLRQRRGDGTSVP